MALIHVTVYEDESFDRAFSRFKKLCSREGILREVKQRRFYEKPSDKQRREKQRRIRKQKRLALKRAGRFN